MQLRRLMATVVAGIAVSISATPVAQAAVAPVESKAVHVVKAEKKAKAASFWCYGTFEVIATRTFGPSDWKQQLGVRNDGARAVRVFHPSGRVDRYRFNNREANGSVWTTGVTRGTEACIVFGAGGAAAAQPEADNGFGWRTGYWQG